VLTTTILPAAGHFIYPSIAAAATLRAKSFTLDGGVVCEPDGIALFEALYRRHKAIHSILLHAFDLLKFDCADLRPMPLSERKTKLAELLARKPAEIAFRLAQAKPRG
jgi:ATP-dependent DNA ligase